MVAWMLLAASSMTPVKPKVDLIEINHYQPSGEHRFTQVLAWDWSHEYRTHHVSDWRIVDDWDVDERLQMVRFRSGGERYAVRYKLFRETTTDTDPERDNIRFMPIEYRSLIFKRLRE